MRDLYNFLKEHFSSFVAVVAVAASISSFLLVVKIDRELLVEAASALAGAGFAVLYAYALIILRQRLRKRDRPRVFIAYNHTDSEFVSKLRESLQEIGAVPVIDRLELNVGDNIRQAVERMIENCDYVIFVASNQTKTSEWNKRELEQAVRMEKKILPVLLEKGALPEELDGVFYADFSSSYTAGFQALSRTLLQRKSSAPGSSQESQSTSTST